jgi:cell division protein FtsB
VRRPSYHHILISAVAGIGIIQMTLFIGYSVFRTFQYSAALESESVQIQNLSADIAQLREVKKHAEYDPSFVRELARCQGFVQRGEIAYVDSARVNDKKVDPCEPRDLLPKP